MDIGNEETIIFDIGNGSKTLTQLRKTYGEKGLKIVDRLVKIGRVTQSVSMDMDLQLRTYYKLDL